MSQCISKGNVLEDDTKIVAKLPFKKKTCWFEKTQGGKNNKLFKKGK